MSNPLISIAMCTYNGERFIKEQLDSIINQTYKNIEIIITDDASTDKTINIIKTYQQKDHRIKLYQNKINLGFIKNFEKSISLTKGVYIALADQDDIWKKNKIELFLKEIGKNILIYSDALLIDDFSKSLGKQLIRPNSNLVKGNNNEAFLLFNCASGNTMMFKRELIPYILPIPKNISFHDIWIAFIASSIGTIHYTEEPMTYYRRYSEQITKTIERNYNSPFDRFRQKNSNTIKNAQSMLLNYKEFNKLNFLNKKTKYFLNLLIEHYATYDKGYFNIKLYKFLIKNKNDVFSIKSSKKRKKYAKRVAIKLKLHQVLLFSS